MTLLIHISFWYKLAWLTHAPTHSLTHSLMRSGAHGLTGLLTPLLTHACTCVLAFPHSLTYSLTFTSIGSLTHQPPVHARPYLLTHSLVHSHTHARTDARARIHILPYHTLAHRPMHALICSPNRLLSYPLTEARAHERTRNNFPAF